MKPWQNLTELGSCVTVKEKDAPPMGTTGFVVLTRQHSFVKPTDRPPKGMVYVMKVL